MLDFPMSQFDKDDVEAAGLLKLDVLGVRMQSAMACSLREIERVDGRKIDLDAVPRDDRDTYDLIGVGRTLGCFQIESPGQRELVAKLEPRTMHDLIVDISLFRPGPVNSDMVTPYLEARHGFREPDYPHERLREPLRETHGVVVFHEQVLRVIDVMTGCGCRRPRRPAAHSGRRRAGRPCVPGSSRSPGRTASPPMWSSGRGGCSTRSAGSVSARRTPRRSRCPPTSRPG